MSCRSARGRYFQTLMGWDFLCYLGCAQPNRVTVNLCDSEGSEISMSKGVGVVVGLVLHVLLGAGGGEAGQMKSQAELRKPFVGTWRLVSIEGGATPANRGAKPTGLIIYDANGY